MKPEPTDQEDGIIELTDEVIIVPKDKILEWAHKVIDAYVFDDLEGFDAITLDTLNAVNWEDMDRVALNFQDELLSKESSESLQEQLSFRSALLVWVQLSRSFFLSSDKVCFLKRFLTELTLWLKQRE